MIRRNKWYKFRKRFHELHLCPFLNYENYWQRIGENNEGADDKAVGVFRFSGGFESVTDGQTLWIRSEDLTVPVSLKNAESYLLPAGKNEDPVEANDPGEMPPERIRWEKVSTLTEGVKVFVGGPLKYVNGCRNFASTKENPLIVIFYYCPDLSFFPQVIQSGRQRNEYWNPVTSYSLVIGAIGLILTAVLYLSRPAYRHLTVIFSIIALFIPLYPIIPPGLLLTGIYRRLTWKSRILRTRSDLVRLGLVNNDPEAARRFTVKAYLLEAAAWVFLPAGITVNIFFLGVVLVLFGALF